MYEYDFLRDSFHECFIWRHFCKVFANFWFVGFSLARNMKMLCTCNIPFAVLHTKLFSASNRRKLQKFASCCMVTEGFGWLTKPNTHHICGHRRVPNRKWKTGLVDINGLAASSGKNDFGPQPLLVNSVKNLVANRTIFCDGRAGRGLFSVRSPVALFGFDDLHSLHQLNVVRSRISRCGGSATFELGLGKPVV